MASEQAVISRRLAANERVRQAVTTLADRAGVGVAPVPQLPNGIDPAFRSMVEAEVLADNLEQQVRALAFRDDTDDKAPAVMEKDSTPPVTTQGATAAKRKAS